MRPGSARHKAGKKVAKDRARSLARVERKANYADLMFAVKWLSLGPCTLRTAVAAAADALLVLPPISKPEGYQLLARFRASFCHSPRPLLSAVSKAEGNQPSKWKFDSDGRAHRVQVEQSSPSWVNGDQFLESYEWRKLRMVVLKKRGARCECCGATPKDGVRMHVDHIQPRRKHPELALTESNLQVLCEVCNHGKGSWDNTDWRADSQLSGKSSADSPVTRSGDGDEQKAANATEARPLSKGCASGPRLLRKLADSA